MASSGETTRSGITVALPPPWVRASRALCPMTAMLAIERSTPSGRTPSLLSSTEPSTAASWANATPSIAARRRGDRVAERADALGEQQQAQHLAVEVRLVHAAVAHRLDEVGPRRRGSGHGEILRGGDRVEAAHGGPVR